MKKNKTSKDWLIKQKRDPLFKESKIFGYRSRSAFKLIELNKKFKFLKKNISLLDLGSFPGGWSQVTEKIVSNGKILALDIKPMEKIKNVDFICGDFEKNEIKEKILLYFKDKADVVISDMAADTSGNKSLDSYRTGQLCIEAMLLASQILGKNGVFLAKIFMGAIYKEISDNAKNYFKKVAVYKPKSSKKESKETYIICKGILKI